MYIVNLQRKVDQNIRYYKIELLKTLFGDYLIEREYGNISYKKPTGTRKNYFDNVTIAKKEFEKIVSNKLKKGYFKIA